MTHDIDYSKLTKEELGIRNAADIEIQPRDPEVEQAYLRGTHHGLCEAFDAVQGCTSVREALKRLAKMEKQASHSRYSHMEKLRQSP